MTMLNATGRRTRRVRRSARSRGGRRALGRLVAAAGRGETAAIEAVAALVRDGTVASDGVWRSAAGDGAWWRGPFAEALWETGSPPPQTVVDGAWAAWLADGSLTGLRERLVAHGRPAAGAERGASVVALGRAGEVTGTPWVRTTLLSCAKRDDHPIGDLARAALLEARHDTGLVDVVCALAADGTAGETLTAFCVEHGLAPADPVERAVYHVLTGQTDQYRAGDPEGTLLERGYQAAPAGERARLRAAMATGGDHDLLRVIARGRKGPLLVEEGRYLAERLAERGDLRGLWHLLPRLPLPVALDETHRFGDWRPGDEEQRDLLEELLRTAGNTGFVAAVLERWGGPPPPPVRIERPTMEVAVSATGDRLAVLTAPESRGLWWPCAIDDYDVAQGEPVSPTVHLGKVTRLLYSGHEILAVQRSATANDAYIYSPRIADVDTPRLWTSEGGDPGPGTTSRVASGPYLTEGGHVTGIAGTSLRFWPTGRTGPLNEWLDIPSALTAAHLVGSDPADSRLALYERSRLLVLDGAHGRVLAWARPVAKVREAVFTGPGSLVTLTPREGGGILRRWRYRPRGPRRPSVRLVRSRELADVPGAEGMHPVRALDVIAVQIKGGGVVFHDMDTLDEVPDPLRCGFAPQALWSHPSGSAVVVSDRPRTEPGALLHVVAPPWDRMLRRPPADLSLADLAALERARDRIPAHELSARLLRLARAVLLARTANDISLGRGHQGPPATDDIAL